MTKSSSYSHLLIPSQTLDQDIDRTRINLQNLNEVNKYDLTIVSQQTLPSIKVPIIIEMHFFIQ